MRVFMLCDFFNESLEYQENLLVKYYRKHGHSVTLVASTFESVFDYYNDQHRSSWPERRYEYLGATIIKLRYRFNILNRLRAYTRIDKILNETAPDLIYIHDIVPNLLECIEYAKEHPQCRIIFDYHADYSNSGKNWLSLKVLHGMIRKWLLNRLRPHLSCIYPIVPSSAKFLHEVYGIPHEEMEILPLGADLDLALEARTSGRTEELRVALGFSTDMHIIFTGGKLAPAKRTEMLIEAMRHLQHRPYGLIIVGKSSESDGFYEDALRDQAKDLPNVRFCGWLGTKDIYFHLAASDMAVFPSSQSILWQQAIAAGLPLVCGDSGGQDISYLNLADNIIVIDKEAITVETLVETIEKLGSDPERLKRMQTGAFRVAEEHLNWDRLIVRTLQWSPAFSRDVGSA